MQALESFPKRRMQPVRAPPEYPLHRQTPRRPAIFACNWRPRSYSAPLALRQPPFRMRVLRRTRVPEPPQRRPTQFLHRQTKPRNRMRHRRILPSRADSSASSAAFLPRSFTKMPIRRQSVLLFALDQKRLPAARTVPGLPALQTAPDWNIPQPSAALQRKLSDRADVAPRTQSS